MDNDDCTHFKWTLSVNMASYVRYRYIYRLMDRYQDLIMLHKTVYKTGKQKNYTLLKKNCSCSFAKLMHACSKLFLSKCSNPKMSSKPSIT